MHLIHWCRRNALSHFCGRLSNTCVKKLVRQLSSTASCSKSDSVPHRDVPIDQSVGSQPDDEPQFVGHYLKRLQGDISRTLVESRSLLSWRDPSDDHHSSLHQMAEYYFSQGKMYRPTVTLLMSATCNCHDPVINEQQYKIALVAEMIHAASLVHDDVIDDADWRRNRPSLNRLWGDKTAILVGDYILAKATQVLCSIGHSRVTVLMAKIIEDLVKGELMQMASIGSGPSNADAGSDTLSTPERHFSHYMEKTFLKTASLFAHSCQSVAILAGCTEAVEQTAFEYGSNLGMAFQLVDDLLDFVAKPDVLGKETASDLKRGLTTAPVLFAIEDHPHLLTLILPSLSHLDNVEKAYKLVMKSKGVEKTRLLAGQHCATAIQLVDINGQCRHIAIVLR